MRLNYLGPLGLYVWLTMFFDMVKSCPPPFSPLFFRHVRKRKDLLLQEECVYFLHKFFFFFAFNVYPSRVDSNQRTLSLYFFH